MRTLHLHDVPEPLHAALHRRAEERRTSISAEVVSLLEQALRSDPSEVRKIIEDYARNRPTAKPGAPSAAELVRADRGR